MTKAHNHLIHEVSPYLLQHAHNPVDWYAWGEEAFARAREEGKPIFLSVGYSTCHWCHVMERESFENEEVARALNEHFISIKVDREELPDVDAHYMLATQMFYQAQGVNRGGGWPNSVFATAEARPFYAGTYFPRAQFLALIQTLANLWQTQRGELTGQADRFHEALEQAAQSETDEMVSGIREEIMERAASQLASRFDRVHGGFGTAPKFPPHDGLSLLFHQLKQTQDLNLVAMVTQTLDAMARGGIHDQIGGGFHRYAVDEAWVVPHFEKMLYDNAQLLSAYASGYELTGHRSYREVADGIFGFVMRELAHPGGGFYAALDADSEGEEGKYYLWTEDALRAALLEEEYEVVARAYGVRSEGNWTEPHTQEAQRTNILHMTKGVEELAREARMEEGVFREMLEGGRRALLEARGKRARPHLDTKVLTSWNGLMIRALAHAGWCLDDERYLEAARRAADHVLVRMVDDSMLYHTALDTPRPIAGYLDDYAYFIAGLVELHGVCGEGRYLDRAVEFADQMLRLFGKGEGGGMYYSSAEHDGRIVRSAHHMMGGNTPAASAVAAEALVLLGDAAGRRDHIEAALGILTDASATMHGFPLASLSLIVAARRYFEMSGEKRLTADAQGIGATDGAEFSDEHFPARVSVYLSRSVVGVGERFYAAARVQLEPNWHVYGENPGHEYLRPVEFRLEEDDSVRGTGVTLPEPLQLHDAAAQSMLNVYTGTFTLMLRLVVGGDGSGSETEVRFTLRVKLQACDDHRCLEPHVFEIPLSIAVSEGADGELQHAEVFGPLLESR